MASSQLLAYKFGANSRFEGQLVGALERAESGGAIRVLDALFVARDSETGEITAFSLGGGSAGLTARLLDFRLDPAARATATRRALDGEHAEAVQALAKTLDVGGAFAAVLVQHVWADALSAAVAQIGGGEAAAEFVEAGRLTEVTERLLTAAA